MLSASVIATAQEPAAVVQEKETCEQAEMLQLAGKLVKYGYESKNALPLIQALQIIQQYNLSEGNETKEETKDSDIAATGEKTKISYSLDPEKIKADAIVLAGTDNNLLALINKPVQKRGAVNGSIVRKDKVLAGHTDVWNITFRGQEQAYVVVSGDGDTDLDLYIYDENGNFITSDTDSTDDCVVSFNPRWTGNFKIKIKNLGNVYNCYTLVTN